MFFRLAFPLIYMFGPRLLPRVIRYLRLIWRLTFDKRVPLFLRLLVPLAIVYFISPVDLLRDWIPVIGRFDDVLVLGLATLLLTKFAPQHVLDDILGPPPTSPRPEDKDPSKVVEGSSHMVDED